MSLVGHRRKHFVRITELAGHLQHVRMVQQSPVEHAVGVDDEPVIDVEARVEYRAVHVSEIGMLARRPETSPGHLADQLPMHRVSNPVLRRRFRVVAKHDLDQAI